MADECAKEGDEELEELLDSALEDFDKTVPSATKHTSGPTVSGDKTRATSRPENSATNVEQSSSSSAANHNDTSSGLGGNVAQDIGNAMRTMLGDSPDLLAQLDQIAQAAAGAEHDNTLLTDLEANLSRTMSHLAQNAKDLESCPTGPFNEDFFKAMSEMSLDGASDGELDFLPLMQGMMENLLSKDVLYPSLKDLQEKYPAWLTEKTASLPPEELKRYSQQYKLVSKICSEYEKESSADSNETKKKRFQKLLGLMQEMQECGQPPLDLIGEMPAAFSGPIPEMPKADEVPEELKNECKVT